MYSKHVKMLNIEYVWGKVTLDYLVHQMASLCDGISLSSLQDCQDNWLQGHLCLAVQWSWPSMGWMGKETLDQWKTTLWRTTMRRRGTPLMIPGWINYGTRCVLVQFPVSGHNRWDSYVCLTWPTGQELWKILQRGAIEPKEGIPASQG